MDQQKYLTNQRNKEKILQGNNLEQEGNKNLQENKAGRLKKIVVPLLQWYDNNARDLPWRENSEPYTVWISEIMLQQTRVEAVKPYYDRWQKAFPTLSALAAAPEEEVLKLWEGLGYYSRARNIHKTAKIVEENYGGMLPSSFEALLKLPGIGEYSAGSIGSIAFQLPVPCVDGNVLRVITRITAEDADITEPSTKKLLTEWVRAIVPGARPGDFNQSLMELGATICLPNGLPKCESCPVSSLCEAFQQNKTTDFPVKKPKPQRKKENRTVLLILLGDKAAVRKRKDSGLLASLWEYPNYPGELKEWEVIEKMQAKGLSPVTTIKLKKAKHIFTHIEWQLSGYLVTLDESLFSGKQVDWEEFSGGEDDFLWVNSDLLREHLTIPSAFKVYHQILLNTLQSAH